MRLLRIVLFIALLGCVDEPAPVISPSEFKDGKLEHIGTTPGYDYIYRFENQEVVCYYLDATKATALQCRFKGGK